MSRLTKWLRLRRSSETLKQPDGVSIGRRTYGFEARGASYVSAEAPLTIGSFCSIGPDVLFLSRAHHNYMAPSTYPLSYIYNNGREPISDRERSGIRVGNDVWIGARATILPGVSIGDGAVVGAAAVIAKDIAPYAIVVGSPSKVIRFRFPPEKIAALLRVAWWNWPDHKIRTQIPLLIGDIDEFLAQHDTHSEPIARCLRSNDSTHRYQQEFLSDQD